MDQPKKFKVLLKPILDSDRRWEIKRARRMQNYPTHPNYRADIKSLEDAAEAEMAKMPPRVIDADMVKIIDDGSLLIGIGPGKRTSISSTITSKRKMHAKALRIRKENPEFYSIGYTPPGQADPNDPSHTDYIITRHFEKILSVNLDNVISINGKQIMGGMRTLDKGTKHLDLEDHDWSVDSISELLDE